MLNMRPSRTLSSLARIALTLNSKNGRDDKVSHKKPTRSGLICITDHQVINDYSTVLSRLPKGSILLFRDYDLPDRAEKALALRKLAQHCGHQFWLAGDIALAMKVKADGVHIPEWQQYQIPQIRKKIRPNMVISTAIHKLPRLSSFKAWAQYVDLALLSPIFPTASHLEAKGLGPIRAALQVQAISRVMNKPVSFYALGGLDARRAARLNLCPFSGIAGISLGRAIC